MRTGITVHGGTERFVRMTTIYQEARRFFLTLNEAGGIITNICSRSGKENYR